MSFSMKLRPLAIALYATFSSATHLAAENSVPFVLDIAPVSDVISPVQQQTNALPVVGMTPLPTNAGDLFFSGERSSHSFPIYVLPEQTAGPISLVVSLESAISNMPELSRMKVMVNEQELQELPLIAGNPRTVTIPIPQGLIQPGYNAISLVVDQAHRVDCSVKATYELWTRVDPARSGLVFSAQASGFTQLADLASAVRGADGKTNIVSILGANQTDSLKSQNLRAIQILARGLGLDHPDVIYSENSRNDGAGIEIAIGSREQLQKIYPPNSKQLEIANGVMIGGDPESKRAHLMIVGTTKGQIDSALGRLDSLLQATPTSGSPAGMRAMSRRNGTRLISGQAVTLKDLGLDTRTFTGRRLTQSVSFEMPPDFYPGDYDRATIALSALYAPGLSPDASLLLKVNDSVIANIGLGASRTGSIERQELLIPLNAFRPGQNKLSIDARLPAPSDLECLNGQAVQTGGRLHIMPGSSIKIPKYARIGRYPDLAAFGHTLTTLNANEDDQRINIFVPSTEPDGEAAAASFIAKLAYETDTVFDTYFVRNIPINSTDPVMIFGSYASIPFDLTRQLNLDFAFAPSIGLNQSQDQEDQPEEFESLERVAESTWVDQGVTQVGKLVSKGWHYTNRVSASLVGLVQDTRRLVSGNTHVFSDDDVIVPLPTNRSAEPLFSPDRSAQLVIAQRLDPFYQKVPWTIVATSTSEGLKPAVTALTHPDVWRLLHGSVQTYSQSGANLETIEAQNTVYTLGDGLSIGNARRLMAGWLSNNPDKYVAMIVLSFVLLGALTYLRVRIGRRKL